MAKRGRPKLKEEKHIEEKQIVQEESSMFLIRIGDADLEFMEAAYFEIEDCEPKVARFFCESSHKRGARGKRCLVGAVYNWTIIKKVAKDFCCDDIPRFKDILEKFKKVSTHADKLPSDFGKVDGQKV